MPDTTTDETHPKPRRKDRWALWLIFLLFLGGLSIRGYSYMTDGPSSARRAIVPSNTTSPSSSQSSFQGDSTTTTTSLKALSAPSDDPDAVDWLQDLAPYFTEGGLSFFLGFCIGLFLRIVARTAAFVIGGLYLALILLSHYGLITVDWGSIQTLLQNLLLNTRAQMEGVQGMLAVGIPSVAMGGLGIWRGLKKP